MKNLKNRSRLIFALPIILTLASLGCGLSGLLTDSAANGEPTPTRTAMPTFTPTPVGVAFVDTTSVDTPPEVTEPEEQPTHEVIAPVVEEAEPIEVAEVGEPSSTPPPPEPTDTPVPAASGPPRVTIVQNMNVRAGPGTNFAVVGPGPAGESANVVGRNADGSWLQVEYPLTDDGTGWLYAPLVEVTGDPTTVAVVQVAAPAPPPEPPKEEAPPPPPPPPEKKYQFTPDGFWPSENAAIVHFKGRFKDEGGNLVNGFSVLLDNGSWSVLSHPSGASHHYPEKGDGEWDVVIPNVATGVGWWWMTVVSYDCPNFVGAFDAQCKQFTRLSEDIKLEVVWPEETVINANWTCHWDCNKGLYVQGFRR